MAKDHETTTNTRDDRPDYGDPITNKWAWGSPGGKRCVTMIRTLIASEGAAAIRRLATGDRAFIASIYRVLPPGEIGTHGDIQRIALSECGATP